MSSSSLQVAVAQTVSFLTRPLVASYPATTLAKVQLVLEANLTALYAPSWHSTQPHSGSAERCLILSPDCLPPRSIYGSCVAAGVQWFDWMRLLGNSEFHLFVDPGCISVKRSHLDSHPVTVWNPTSASTRPRFDTIQAATKRRQEARQRTFAQEVLENDNEEDEQLFTMLADRINAPQWMTPVTDKFPSSIFRSRSPLSSISSGSTMSSLSTHSRSSSFSSNASNNGYSMDSSSSSSSSTISKQSRRSKAQQTRVYIDPSKNEVTPYDGGKTTVLTGGVMLGSRRA